MFTQLAKEAPVKRMSEAPVNLNYEKMNRGFVALQNFVQEAASSGAPAHEVERNIWEQLLGIGRSAFGYFLTSQGSGDLGEEITLPNGESLPRLDKARGRRLVTVFGTFSLKRAVYGERVGQKAEFIPLDTRLGLPKSDFSYLLQDWDQSLAIENSYSHTSKILERILGFSQAVDSLERMNRSMAEEVPEYRDSKPIPAAIEEGEILVVSADGKGVPIRRESGEAAIFGHRKKGQKKNKKRMATVGAIYTIDPLPRTPEQVVESLFRDPTQDRLQKQKDRPHPVHKELLASLTHEEDGQEINSADVVFHRLSAQAAERNPAGIKASVAIMDGQKSLWEMLKEYFPEKEWVEVLDLLHVTPRLWQAAHLFHREGSVQATEFVKERLLSVLQGNVGYVIGGFRQMGTKARLGGAKKTSLRTICNYLEKNRERMRYDEYLKAGYPIASGVIEGACRHLVKDRMERAGMRWSMCGAQAMLDLRSTFLNADWDAFTQYRIRKQTESLYPYQKLVQKIDWPMAA